MTPENELSIHINEYHLSIPGVPKQFVDVFGRDVAEGKYGLSSEQVGVIFEYVKLQRVLSGFNDLVLSSGFIEQLPEEFRQKLSRTLQPGIPLKELEIPTAAKTVLVRMLAADSLTDLLSQSPVEIWVNSDTQGKLEQQGNKVDLGLQRIDYTQLSLESKLFLVELMERQEGQVHKILLARNCFLDGVPALNYEDILFGKGKRVYFNVLQDLEGQYQAACRALDNPQLLFFGEVFERVKQRPPKDELLNQNDNEDEGTKTKQKPEINVEEEAKGDWWEQWERKEYEEIMEEVAAYLRPQYKGKTIYEILGADTPEKKGEILTAFWRRIGEKAINFGDEPWIEDNLYLKPDGSLEFHTSEWGRRNKKRLITGELKEDFEVAIIDQAVKWIRQEMQAMAEVKKQWQELGLQEEQIVECTLVFALQQSVNPDVQKEINGLPKWFLDMLNQEISYFGRLPLQHFPKFNISDLLLHPLMEKSAVRNLLKEYFVISREQLNRFGNLVCNPKDCCEALGLDSTATQEQIRKAYRTIALETKPIFIESAQGFDPEQWKLMNERFIKAARAYEILSRHKFGEARVTSLGKISSYFGTDY